MLFRRHFHLLIRWLNHDSVASYFKVLLTINLRGCSACDNANDQFQYHYCSAPKVWDTHRRVRGSGGNCLRSTHRFDVISSYLVSWSPLVRDLSTNKVPVENQVSRPPQPSLRTRPSTHPSYFQLDARRLAQPGIQPLPHHFALSPYRFTFRWPLGVSQPGTIEVLALRFRSKGLIPSHKGTRLVSPAAPEVLQPPVASGIFTPLINDLHYPMSCCRNSKMKQIPITISL